MQNQLRLNLSVNNAELSMHLLIRPASTSVVLTEPRLLFFLYFNGKTKVGKLHSSSFHFTR